VARLRTYTELAMLDTFEDRFRYLALRSAVGAATFGFDRWLNQRFYSSYDWRRARRDVIVRDLGCDLGVEGHEIRSRIVIHHLNPITQDDLLHGNALVLDPEFLITTTHDTHNAIHYGDERLLPRPLAVRTAGDTSLWRRS
jgi:hypothetical protein